jgi:hypothetical protein
MATGKLTALAVDRAHREGRPAMLCDGGGLYFRKQTRDGAAWTLRYRFTGRARWMTLGNHPDMSLADARIEPREKRTMLDKQRDPLPHGDVQRWRTCTARNPVGRGFRLRTG